jgi:hypothetical protein
MAFLKGIFDRLTKPGSVHEPGAPPQVHLAAFGKHPGWDDHIDDLGLNTEALIAIKRSLYLNGIGGNFDAGTWDALAESQRLAGFNHLFLWRTMGSNVIGKMIASTDGKGRGRYPMIVCADCGNLPVDRVVSEVWDRVSSAVDQCRSAGDAQSVRGIISATQAELKSAGASSANGNSPAAALAASLAELANAPELGPDGSKLHLVLFQIEREMASYKTSTSNSRLGHRAAAHLRVPACAETPQRAVEIWLQFLGSQLAMTTPIISVASVQGRWVDLIVGDAQTKDFYCLLASRETIPLTTDIPYTMDSEFVARAAQMVAEFRAGSV